MRPRHSQYRPEYKLVAEAPKDENSLHAVLGIIGVDDAAAFLLTGI